MYGFTTCSEFPDRKRIGYRRVSFRPIRRSETAEMRNERQLTGTSESCRPLLFSLNGGRDDVRFAPEDGCLSSASWRKHDVSSSFTSFALFSCALLSTFHLHFENLLSFVRLFCFFSYYSSFLLVFYVIYSFF
jgi:hypothetical protein